MLFTTTTDLHETEIGPELAQRLKGEAESMALERHLQQILGLIWAANFLTEGGLGVYFWLLY